ncbi:predicted protein [Mycolicibacterium novocastrense]|uniref:Uncharacterized protein n=1 Tax=Mycolicibacterium novocastrense TaxID=59813 RepID=A0ABQ0KSI6_MYCNV|nr:predicted protein [Mycolicibacterium novocastrense]
MGKDLVSVLQLNAEHRIGQGFDHATLDLYGTVFLGHCLSEILRVLIVGAFPPRAADTAAAQQTLPTTEREPVARNS